MKEQDFINALKLLGFNYITCDIAGNVTAHKNYPKKMSTLWYGSGRGNYDLYIKNAYGLFQSYGMPSERPYIISDLSDD